MLPITDDNRHRIGNSVVLSCRALILTPIRGQACQSVPLGTPAIVEAGSRSASAGFLRSERISDGEALYRLTIVHVFRKEGVAACFQSRGDDQRIVDVIAISTCNSQRSILRLNGERDG